MNDLDQKIHVTPRDNARVEATDVIEDFYSLFRGPQRWLTVLMFVVSFAFFFVAAWAAVRFYGAETVTQQLRWGALALLFMLFVMFMKVWFWLEMHTNRVLRELKRIELLLVSRPAGK